MSTTDPPLVSEEAGYRLVRDTAALWEPQGLAWIEIFGEDRKEWLQGQQTSDLRALQEGGSLQLCFCTPTGQLLADGTLWAQADRYVLCVPASGAEAVLRRCQEMVFLEDVRAVATAGCRVLTVQGPDATPALSELLELPLLDVGESSVQGSSVRCLRSDRSGSGGWDLQFRDEAQRAIQAMKERFAQVPATAVETLRIEAGIPLLGVDTGARTLPPELGAAYESSHVSYSKGCYTGQEVLMRIHTQGHTNRTWMGLLCDKPVSPGEEVCSARRADAGKVTSASVSPRFGPIAAAMLRNEAAVGGDQVEIESHEGRVRATICAFPLGPPPAGELPSASDPLS